MPDNAKRFNKKLFCTVLIVSALLFMNSLPEKMIHAGEKATSYNVFTDIANLQGTLRKKAHVSKQDHYILLLAAQTHDEYMRDRYGLIVWYKYKDKIFTTKYCLIKNKEEELFFTESLDELLNELKKVPRGNKIYSYSMTCGGPKDVAYVGEDDANLEPRRVDRKVYVAIGKTCKAAGNRFINYEFDKSEKRVICTCP